MSKEPSDLDPVDELVDEFLTRRQAGEELTISEFCQVHAELQNELREVLPTLMMLENSKTVPTSSEVSPPEVIGDYSLDSEIGRGGMGVVYRATQLSLGRTVALKVLSSRWAADGTAMKRFRREAQAAANLHHTNIVPVYEVGEIEGHCYYAMQLIEGTSLDKLVAELAKASSSSDSHWRRILTSNQSIDLSESNATVAPADSTTRQPEKNYFQAVASIGIQAADALAYAHARGIIHRDIKPSNLLFDERGVVWITDFGLAKTDSDAMTRDGDVLGTLCYMSPERFRQQCDARADVYALGQTLYELLTRRPAFPTTDRLELISMISEVEPTPPREIDPSIPRDLETVVLKAMEKRPETRYQSAEDLSTDLRCFMDDRPVAASRITPVGRALRWARRNRLVASLMTAVVCLLLAIAIVSTFSAANYRRQSEEIRDISSIAQDRLVEVLRLSDSHDLRDLVEREARLWPAHPQQIPAMKQWLAEAEKLVAQLPDYQESLAELQTQAMKSDQVPTDVGVIDVSLQDELKLLYAERDKVKQQIKELPQNTDSKGYTILNRSESTEYTHPSHATHYFRTNFPVKNASLNPRFQLCLWADDGAIVYLNGKEVFRFNLPNGEVSNETLSLRDVSDDHLLCSQEHEFEASLEEGENVIAVELHQSDYNSSDAYFDLRLMADGEIIVPRGSEWHYFDHGIPLVTWKDSKSSHTPWDSGVAPLGFGFTEPLGRLKELKQRLADLEDKQETEPVWIFADSTLQWQHDSLADMVRVVEHLIDDRLGPGPLQSVRERLTFATAVEQRSLIDYRTDWEDACRSIANPKECPQYNGLQITPQLGLVPVGRDPQSGLWEFAHLQTGEVPSREEGKLQITEDTGLVFILLPGGTYRMGARPPRFGANLRNEDDRWIVESIESGSLSELLGVLPGDELVSVQETPVSSPEGIHQELMLRATGFELEAVILRDGVRRELNATLPPNTDAFAGDIEQPILETTLQPFFLSKYEMTQGQWQRITGNNPSLWESGVVFGGVEHTLLHPVENVSWQQFYEVVDKKLGLLLPTEAQWEYAARAGTDTMWWVGNASRELIGKTNLADKTASNYPNNPIMIIETWLEDGYVLHCPVNRFESNQFGFHGMVGNVSEWCRDPFSKHPDVFQRDGTGEKIQLFDNQFRAVRGGHFRSSSITGRSAARAAGQTTHRATTVGVRPAREID